jgi:hypothetical protein
MKPGLISLASLLFLSIGALTLDVGSATGATDTSDHARQMLQELTTAPAVSSLRGQKVLLPDLMVSDESDKTLASSAKEFRQSLQTALINTGRSYSGQV